MAVVFVEGFDNLTAAEMTSKNGWATGPTSMVAGRFDGQAARVASSGNRSAVLPASYATLIVGFAWQASAFGVGGNGILLYLLAGSTNVAIVETNSAQRLQVVNQGGTVIATGTTVLAINTWYYVEVEIVVNGASGSCQVHLGGVTEISSTAGNFGTSNIDHLGITGPNVGGSQALYDDMYACDTTGSAPQNTFLGDVRVETIYPAGAGTHSAWTPNSGTTHYTQVDEAQADGDTTYVSDATPGDLDSYTFGHIDTGATVYAVQTNLYARKDDANTRQIAPLIRQAGTDYPGATVTLASTYLDYTQIYNQDPTGSAWTATNVNGDEFGVKEVA